MKRFMLIFLAATACQDVSIGVGGTQAPIPQPDAIRIHVTPDGLTHLYDVASEEGFFLSAPPQTISSLGQTWELGPVVANLPVLSRSSNYIDDSLRISTLFGGLRITVPIRVRTANDVEICRFQVRFVSAVLDADISLEDGSLGSESAPLVTLGDAVITRVGACSIDASFRDSDAVTLSTRLTEYLEEGLVSSTIEAMFMRPLDTIGVITDAASLRRVSVFEHRRGSIGVIIDESTPAILSADGFEASLNLGLLAQRAPCAPPVESNPTDTVATQSILSSKIATSGADLGMAISGSSLQRLAESLTLGGFVCRGLEDARRPEENAELFATDDLVLDDLELGWVPVGPWIRAVSAPGSLPTLTLRPATNDVVLSWTDFSIDLYGEVQGTLVRLLRLTTSAHATLRPQIGADQSLPLKIDALTIDAASITSDWLRDELSSEVVLPWARRSVLLILENQFEFPLPLITSRTVNVKDVEVRQNDVVLYLKFRD
jgi:hypothetical protein